MASGDKSVSLAKQLVWAAQRFLDQISNAFYTIFAHLWSTLRDGNLQQKKENNAY